MKTSHPALRVCLSLLSVGLAVALLAVVLPRATHAGWEQTIDREAALSLHQLLGLITIWALGLYTYTYALAGALPGLHRRRALVLNLSGSGLSNVLPFGGAAGIGLNYAMLRSWGFDRPRVATFTVVSQT